MPRWELASCSLRFDRRAGRAADLADVTPAIEAILEDNMDAEDIAEDNRGASRKKIDAKRAERMGVVDWIGADVVVVVVRWKGPEGKIGALGALSYWAG